MYMAVLFRTLSYHNRPRYHQQQQQIDMSATKTIPINHSRKLKALGKASSTMPLSRQPAARVEQTHPKKRLSAAQTVLNALPEILTRG